MQHEEQLQAYRAMTPEQRLEIYVDLMRLGDKLLQALEPEELRRRFALVKRPLVESRTAARS